jgi:copper chaperone CopZ
MKWLKSSIVILSFFAFNFMFAQENAFAKQSFKVRGNCEMCKSKIEKAAKSVNGVKSAKWNMVTGKMNVKYNKDKTTIDIIQQSIAEVGYDTEEYVAKDEDYDNLHYCCKYKRD